MIGEEFQLRTCRVISHTDEQQRTSLSAGLVLDESTQKLQLARIDGGPEMMLQRL